MNDKREQLNSRRELLKSAWRGLGLLGVGGAIWGTSVHKLKGSEMVLGLGFVLSAILGFAAFEAINPITMLHRGIIFGFGMGWIYVVAVFLFDVAAVEDGWCGHLCPLGAFYSLAGRYSLIKVKHNTHKCTLCMLCKDVCHERQVLKSIGQRSGYISGECSNCRRCIEVCDDNALNYSINIFKLGRVKP